MKSKAVEFKSNHANAREIAEHLSQCDSIFVPPLSGRVDIVAYAQKIENHAVRFEAWSVDTLVGLVAMYCNDLERRIAFISSVSVLRNWERRGIAAELVNQGVKHAEMAQMRQVKLEVASENTSAIRLYERSGFTVVMRRASLVSMTLQLSGRCKYE